ncbi:NAD(P)H-binding protein [Kitasatospora sp. CM 4170]|uniref:NAD(P)-dependent oxidoreductase n=1 Tax=Kitasatospora aburaviensis TaxID=67265 RepID=A0ABW1F1D1_9ACTN|nr:NAD(P)H-binding protein [Kitasatospora sp. CM 4170]WNM47226.1 NAD(P)H-binding protein [Kitasatospora sp. CM 4170]
MNRKDRPPWEDLMKIAVVGAAGRTGRLVVDLALAAGHTVTAVARTPARLPEFAHGTPLTAQADVHEPGSLREPLAGQDAVVSALGTSGRAATTVFSDGARELVAAARAGGARHVVVMSSAGLETDHLPFAQRVVTRLVVDRLYREIHRDLARMEEVLTESDTVWTVVRAPMLKDGPASANPRVSYGLPLARAGTASRATIAAWIVDHLGAPETFRRRVTIADG